MKTNFLIKCMSIMFMLALFYVKSNAQTGVTADTIRNTCGEGASDILLQICDSTVMQLKAADGNVKINTNLQVPNGYITADSLNVRVIANDSIRFKGSAVFDSIRMDSGSIVANALVGKAMPLSGLLTDKPFNRQLHLISNMS